MFSSRKVRGIPWLTRGERKRARGGLLPPTDAFRPFFVFPRFLSFFSTPHNTRRDLDIDILRRFVAGEHRTSNGKMDAPTIQPKFLANASDLGLVAVGFSGGQVRHDGEEGM